MNSMSSFNDSISSIDSIFSQARERQQQTGQQHLDASLMTELNPVPVFFRCSSPTFEQQQFRNELCGMASTCPSYNNSMMNESVASLPSTPETVETTFDVSPLMMMPSSSSKTKSAGSVPPALTNSLYPDVHNNTSGSATTHGEESRIYARIAAARGA